MTEDHPGVVESTPFDELCRQAAELIGAAKGPLKSVRVRAGEMSVELEWPEATAAPNGQAAVMSGQAALMSGQAAVAPGLAVVTPAQEPAAIVLGEIASPEAENAIVISAPLVGTLYLAPSPGARPFAEVGDVVEAGQQVAIVEAMKLMNAVEAECSGRVVKVLVPDGTSVEYGEPLFVLAPA